MKEMKKLLLIMVLFSRVILLFAADINFNISVDKRKTAIGNVVYLNLNFEGTQDISAPNLGTVEGFSVRYVGPSSKLSFVNGKSSVAITHIYVLVPLKAGVFTIGPFSIDYEGSKYASEEIKIEVVDALGNDRGRQESHQDSSLEDRIFLTMAPEKSKVYMNEIFPLKIKLYVNSLGVKYNRFPEIIHKSFSLSKISDSVQYKDVIGGKTFDVVEFDAEAFALNTGELTLGPASLQCDVLIKKQRRKGLFSFDDFDSLFGDFFGDYDRYPLTLSSPEVPITVLSLPDENKPPSFQGAIGQFDFDIQASPVELNVGDPITFRLIVKGEGNFDTVRFTDVYFNQQDFKVYQPQITSQKDSKIFEYVIIPLKENIEDIPKITFSFFDPKESSYKTIEKGPVKIQVNKPEKKEDIKIIESQSQETGIIQSQKIGRDIIFIKNSLGKITKKDSCLYKNRLFWLLQILPLICFFFIIGIYKHFYKIKTDHAYAKKLRASKIARRGIKEAAVFLDMEDCVRFYETIFKTLQKYLGYKLHTPWQGITSDITAVVGEKGLDSDILDNLKAIMSDCDLARYAPTEFNKDKMRQTLSHLRIVLDYLERKLR